MSCIIMGDSIAVAVHSAAPDCRMTAQVGISSSAYAAKYVQRISDELAVISLGANDHGVETTAALREIRLRIFASRVVWLKPANPDLARLAVAMVAYEFGDEIVDIAPYVGPDGVHPARNCLGAIAHRAGADR